MSTKNSSNLIPHRDSPRETVSRGRLAWPSLSPARFTERCDLICERKTWTWSLIRFALELSMLLVELMGMWWGQLRIYGNSVDGKVRSEMFPEHPKANLGTLVCDTSMKLCTFLVDGSSVCSSAVSASWQCRWHLWYTEKRMQISKGAWQFEWKHREKQKRFPSQTIEDWSGWSYKDPWW